MEKCLLVPRVEIMSFVTYEDKFTQFWFVLLLQKFMEKMLNMIELMRPIQQNIILRFSIIPLRPHLKFISPLNAPLPIPKNNRSQITPLLLLVTLPPSHIHFVATFLQIESLTDHSIKIIFILLEFMLLNFMMNGCLFVYFDDLGVMLAEAE